MKIYRAKSGFFKGLNPTVALFSKLVIVVFVLFGTLMTERASQTFDVLKKNIILGLNWYYIGVVAFFLFFVIWLLLSRYGDVRLGDDDEKPEFSYFSWFAMLFSAGMGIGLVFWSIAEPIYHFQSNPFITEGLTPEAADMAMRITFLHWGLHPWAIYVIVGLSLAYFAYRKKLPLTIRSALYPIIGDRIYGPIGHAVDVLAVFGTVFGLATSLGLGAQQMDTGLAHLFGYDSYATVEKAAINNKETYIEKQCVELSGDAEKACVEAAANKYPKPFPTSLIFLIVVVTGIATWSVVSGVGRGVKILSEINLLLSFALLAFFLAFGPTRYLLNSWLQSTGDYLGAVIPLSLWTDAHGNSGWQDGWTTFYWGWWIAWSPFVGIFIARISRGRTIREFILGVLLVPTALAFVWLTLFGGTALYLELFHTVVNQAGETVAAIGQAGIVEAVKNDKTIALYTTFEKMDVGIMGTIASGVATVLIATYFITSSDSATLVVCTILSIGNEEPPIFHRIFWGIGEGAVAGVLLILGGLQALQTASITAALPFSFIILVMVYGLVKALREEKVAAPLHRP
ncbi:MAG: BCCT family transporter [Candidatus Parabeggiatoa sp. nov. 2]|nr:MAG: choline transporter [Beggiatoa sp. 4572_84]RKZ64460.1 MAG: BCCT family transporter [Gammaproteobacteria bacterium]HEC84566.1 BCCT family transporter [Thioploca sp.]